MKDGNLNNDSSSGESKKPSRKTSKTKKAVAAPILDSPDVNAELDPELLEYITSLIKSSASAKYAAAAEKHNKEMRVDFESLQHIISEFLDDFILIGHTVDGQRLVMRYTPTPADYDKLNELTKNVLLRVLRSGQLPEEEEGN